MKTWDQIVDLREFCPQTAVGWQSVQRIEQFCQLRLYIPIKSACGKVVAEDSTYT
jgi:hypothetical protein